MSDSFWQPLTVNVGSSLIVVTVVFGIFELFRRRRAEKNSIDRTEDTQALIERIQKNQSKPSPGQIAPPKEY